ncbi:MAG: DUF2723 domain-containing protein [Bacteroidales bacterium]|jgi:hypothetical protein|nr:DUF2723 domain-containing protein [Bacteroidales bacterium]
MRKFKRWNDLTGWCCFAVAACTYLSTIEPTVSFWDCGEFIAAADKLEVGHPPGAPLFLLITRIFAVFAPAPHKVAMMVNIFSALASAFTILFLFHTITHIARRILVKERVCTLPCMVAVSASGVIGALAYTFSDTFWFSAVEGEVYAASSLFTAVVFWAILKWEAAGDTPYANRWLILIAYLMGLSIGVHLLNLLAVPAIVLVYYFRRHTPTRRGVLLALLCSAVILAGILYVIIPWTVKLAGYAELLFVNGFGLPFNSGVLCYIALLVALVIGGLRYTFLRKKYLVHTVMLCITMILIGYSSYSVVVIRSLANPPMDENSPDNVFALMSYLNREQYGDRPLLYGQYYNAPETGRTEDNPIYTQLNGRYEITHRNIRSKYDPRFNTLFPRMYSADPSHVEVYKSWGNVKGRPVRVKDHEGKETAIYSPTFAENIRFFLTYQLGHMYGRYFLWNFAGRQNDTPADGSILNGNWLSGIPFIDAPRIGSQERLPDHRKNDAGRNVYFMLPLLLGIVGLLWQLQLDVKYFWVVMTLFFMTGVAIVIYLNQTPLQPRERDYAYAGSFYAFAVWIGLGVAAIYDRLKRKIPAAVSLAAACLLSASVPAVMAQQNYRDHDRSDSHTARDIACNYLNSCAPNAILFTIGDNDTFPLWYLQEVEGVRTDVRVVNLMLLRADWYISQMKLAVRQSKPLPVAIPEEKYLTGRRDVIYLIERTKDTIDLRQALDFIGSDDPSSRITLEPGVFMDYCETKNFSLKVDKRKVLNNGTVKPELAGEIPETVPFRIGSSFLTKEQWMVLEIIAANNWERPVYWTSCRHGGTVGLDDYLQLEGAAYRLTPVKTPAADVLSTGRIDADTLYHRLMNVFRWGRFEQPGAWIDNQNIRTLNIIRARHLYTRLALQLLEEDRQEQAVETLHRALTLFPPEKLPCDYYSLLQAEALYLAGQTEKANDLLYGFADYCLDELHYFYSLPEVFFEHLSQTSKTNEALLGEITRVAKAFGQDAINDHIRRRLEQQQ